MLSRYPAIPSAARIRMLQQKIKHIRNLAQNKSISNNDDDKSKIIIDSMMNKDLDKMMES
jgi:hypothetical protein